MSDPRRKRQIKTPSGPRKKVTQDLSKYKMSPPPTGRQAVPKPQPKPDPSRQRSQGGQRGDRGGQRRQGGRGQGKGKGHQNQPRAEPKELKDESWARVLEHDVKGGKATVMAEKSLMFCSLKVKATKLMPINHRIFIGKDRSKRTEVVGIDTVVRLDKMSNMARQDVPSLVQMFVEEHAQYFVDEFYNKAGPMSLKQHSYELLPEVGPKKAQNMVKAREQVGVFASMDELNAKTKIKGAALLAQRFVEELEDKTLVPRLIELLLPVES